MPVHVEFLYCVESHIIALRGTDMRNSHSRNSSGNKPRHLKKRQFQLETLERRELMAVNILGYQGPYTPVVIDHVEPYQPVYDQAGSLLNPGYLTVRGHKDVQR